MVSKLDSFGRIKSSLISERGVLDRFWSSVADGLVESKYNNPVTCLFSVSAKCYAFNADIASDGSWSEPIVSRRKTLPSNKVMSWNSPSGAALDSIGDCMGM